MNEGNEEGRRGNGEDRDYEDTPDKDKRSVGNLILTWQSLFRF